MGEFWGLTSDGWIAIGTFASALAIAGGALFGLLQIRESARQFLAEQEAKDVRRYLIDDGAWKLASSLDSLLQTIRQNYVIGHHLVRYVRDMPAGLSGSPSGRDFPQMIPLDRVDLAFAAVRPTSRLLRCDELGIVATKAFAALYNADAIFVAEIEQSVKSYYSGSMQLPEDERKALAEGLAELLNKNYFAAEKFRELPGWLEDASLRAQEMRLRRFDEIGRAHADQKIQEIADKIRSMAKDLEKVDDSSDPSSSAG